MILKQFSRDILQIFFPNICQLCGCPLPHNRYYVCQSCYKALLPFNSDYYQILIERMGKIQFDDIFITFQFTEEFKNIIHLLKYSGYQNIATLFAESLIPLVTKKYDFITSVPLHPQKERERGFNQSTLIARKLGEYLDIPFQKTLLRQRYTPSQTKLNRLERKMNMQNAFMLTADVRNQKLLLVDDVLTTGATLNACASVLNAGKCKGVDGIALSTPIDILQEKLEESRRA